MKAYTPPVPCVALPKTTLLAESVSGEPATRFILATVCANEIAVDCDWVVPYLTSAALADASQVTRNCSRTICM